MNKNIILLALSFLFFFSSCEKDLEHWNGDIELVTYDLSEGEEGSFQRDIYDFYQDYGSVIIVDPDSSDYRYDMEQINKYEFVKAQENTENYRKAISILKEIFIDVYPKKFIKDNLNFGIILSQKTTKLEAAWNEDKTPRFVFRRSFFAMSGVDDIANITEDDKIEMRKDINKKFWVDNMYKNFNKYKISQDFYEPCKSYYSKNVGESLSMEELYSLGFIKGGFLSFICPSENSDLMAYFDFMFSKTEESQKEFLAQYPVVRKKYNILKYALENQFGLKLSDIVVE